MYRIFLIFSVLLFAGCVNTAEPKDLKSLFERENPDATNYVLLEPISMKVYEEGYLNEKSLIENFYRTLQRIKKDPAELDNAIAHWQCRNALAQKVPVDFGNEKDWLEFRKMANQPGAEPFCYKFRKDFRNKDNYGYISSDGFLVIKDGKITYKHIINENRCSIKINKEPQTLKQR